jgi:uncharacterized protein YdaU (DUF1376 family)
MAKDPAFLFYPGDYVSGTMGMTFEEKGAYVDLLMLQFNRGHMTLHMIQHTVGHLWDQIKSKFKQDEDGLWYNVRLDFEKERRKNFTKSRRNNLSSTNKANKKEPHMKQHMNSHMSEHMENENINENIIINENKTKIKKALIPNFDEFLEYAKTKEPNVDSSDLKLKYDSWLESDWSINRSGKYQKIVYWKSTLLNTLPYIKKLTVSSGPQKAQRNQYL